MGKKKKKHPNPDLFDTKSIVSSNDQTGLTPSGVLTDEDSRAFRNLYGADIPDAKINKTYKKRK
jgi:hypothetical protein